MGLTNGHFICFCCPYKLIIASLNICVIDKMSKQDFGRGQKWTGEILTSFTTANLPLENHKIPSLKWSHFISLTRAQNFPNWGAKIPSWGRKIFLVWKKWHPYEKSDILTNEIKKQSFEAIIHHSSQFGDNILCIWWIQWWWIFETHHQLVTTHHLRSKSRL